MFTNSKSFKTLLTISLLTTAWIHAGNITSILGGGEEAHAQAPKNESELTFAERYRLYTFQRESDLIVAAPGKGGMEELLKLMKSNVLDHAAGIKIPERKYPDFNRAIVLEEALGKGVYVIIDGAEGDDGIASGVIIDPVTGEEGSILVSKTPKGDAALLEKVTDPSVVGFLTAATSKFVSNRPEHLRWALGIGTGTDKKGRAYSTVTDAKAAGFDGPIVGSHITSKPNLEEAALAAQAYKKLTQNS